LPLSVGYRVRRQLFDLQYSSSEISAGRESYSVNVSPPPGAVLIFGFLDFPVRFEINDGPAELSTLVDNTFDEFEVETPLGWLHLATAAPQTGREHSHPI
jgi:hypothetical protein